MTKRRLCLLLSCATAGLLLAGLGLTNAQEREPAHLDTQKLLLQNMLVRVWEIHVPVEGFEPKHSHARGLTIAMSEYEAESKTIPEGKVRRNHLKFGEVNWAEPVTHEVRNVGRTAEYVVRVELK